MDSEPAKNAPRKLKFKPKSPPRRRAPKLEVKAEKVEDDMDAFQAMNLMRQFQERSVKARPKDEKKLKSSQIAFGYGAGSTSLKSFGIPKHAISSNAGQASGGAHPSGLKEKEYIEPWDYYTYYPVSLPLRRPYSGNPAMLDQEEFGEASEAMNYDENLANPAEKLGLLEENLEPSMFFLQLPPTMPMKKQSGTTDGNEVKDSSRPVEDASTAERAYKLNELPAGFMGKMLVHRSGAVKLKLGDTLYDVFPGMDCAFSQDVVAVNTAEKHCCSIEEINKRAIVTPDVSAIMDSVSNL